MQYKTKAHALRALSRMTTESIISPEGGLSPAEDLLLGALIQLEDKKKLSRDFPQGSVERKLIFDRRAKQLFHRFRSVGRGLGLYPIPEWARGYVAVKLKMGNKQLQEETVPWRKYSPTIGRYASFQPAPKLAWQKLNTD